MLIKLGADNNMINKCIIYEIGMYFNLPLLISLISIVIFLGSIYILQQS